MGVPNNNDNDAQQQQLLRHHDDEAQAKEAPAKDIAKRQQRRKNATSNDGLDVFIWGGPDKLQGENQPVNAQELCGANAWQISCAKDASYVLTTDGHVQQWGVASSEWSRQHSHATRPITTTGNGPLTLIPEKYQGDCIVQLACGRSHHAAVGASGNLYTWGNGTCGQLGHDVDNDEHVVVKSYALPKRVKYFSKLDTVFVRQVACGANFTMAVTRGDGQVYTWGKNEFGLTGHGTGRGRQLQPRRVDALKHSFVTYVTADGAWHAAAVTDHQGRQRLYTWGNGAEGQLGHGDKRNRYVPTLVEALEDYEIGVTRVACGCFHTAVLSEQGHVYTFGFNDQGQLGQFDRRERLEPTRVKGLLDGTIVVQIACGMRHCAAVNNRGEMFTWGQGEHGQLGHGDYASQTQPQLVRKLQDHKVLSIASFAHHTVALVDPSPLATTSHSADNDDASMLESLRGMVDNPECADVEFWLMEDEDDDDSDGSSSSGDYDKEQQQQHVKIYAHRALLIQRSDYFRTMFCNGMMRESQPSQQQVEDGQQRQVVPIHDIPAHIFRLVLEFMYTGKVVSSLLRVRDVVHLFVAADMYDLKTLQRTCTTWLQNKLTIANAATLLQLTTTTTTNDDVVGGDCCAPLKHVCLQFVVQHFGQVSQTVEFRQIANLELCHEILQELAVAAAGTAAGEER